MDNRRMSPNRVTKSLFKRSCEACRTRKVRCDKGSPCSACKVSKLSCISKPTDPGLRQKKHYVSRDYEKKIDLIQEKLTGLDRVIQDVARKSPISAPSATDEQLNRPVHYISPLTANESQVEENGAFEGESSLHAHSVYARELLERTIGNSSIATSSNEMSSAISSLQQIAGKFNGQTSSQRGSLQQPSGERCYDLRKLLLPPTNAVLEVLRRSKDCPTLTLAIPMTLNCLPRITELCKAVFFCVDDYPISTAILVHGTLYYMFQEFSWTSSNEQERSSFIGNALLCRKNLEASLARLDLLLPATPDNIEALLLGASYAIEISKTTLSWKLNAAACSLAQDLGWHRSASMKSDAEDLRNRKVMIFWYLYYIDKTLSLRLGRASVLHSYDIDLPLPESSDDQLLECGAKLIRLWVAAASIEGAVYEQLYSPGALKAGELDRIQKAIMLEQQCQTLREEYEQAKFHEVQLSQPTHTDALRLINHSDEVLHYTVLTMIHRAIPPLPDEKSGFRAESLQAARSALMSHCACAVRYQNKNPDMWSMYLHWTILHAPFVPFIVIFCHVLATTDEADLQRLNEFVSTLSSSAFSDGAQRMHRLCSVLYNIARLIVEAKGSSSPVEQSTTQFAPQLRQGAHRSTETEQAQPWGQLNPYLDALGFAGDPVVEGNAAANASLEDWFHGNQYIMGLLEDDLPFLDTL